MPKRPPLAVRQADAKPAGRWREIDARRGTAAQRGYNARWQRMRRRFLSRPENALCVMCRTEGLTTEATVVDHIVPHRGDPALMWDETNLQPLCASHHGREKQQMESTGRVKGADLSGRPVDPGHPWNRSDQ